MSMTDRRFWDLIDSTRKTARGDVAAQDKLLKRRLKRFAPQNIVAYQRKLDDLVESAASDELYDELAEIEALEKQVAERAAQVDADPDAEVQAQPEPEVEGAVEPEPEQQSDDDGEIVEPSGDDDQTAENENKWVPHKALHALELRIDL